MMAPRGRMGHDFTSKNVPYIVLTGMRARTTEDFLARVRDILHWGVGCYPMRYEPIDFLDKNKYISEKWTKKQIDMVQRARRVIGFGGLFPPYKKLIEKFDDANSFEKAFKLRPQNTVKSS